MFCCACGPSSAAVRIEGKVQAGGGPVVNSTVTLWAATVAAPRQLSQTRTTSDGDFELASQDTLGTDITLYEIAEGGEAGGSGDNSALAMLAVVGNPPPPRLSSMK
jgi:hypothetical protein